MARGFESKDVEYQQAEAQRGRRPTDVATPQQREANARRRTLELSLTRAEADSLYAWGVNAAHDFFTAPDQQAYLNEFGKTVASAPATNGQPAPQPEVAGAH